MATSARESDHPFSPQEFLAQLHQLYDSRPVRRDPFGRRKALVSEIAQALTHSAENTELPAEECSGEHPFD